MRIRTFSPYFKPTGFSRWLFSLDIDHRRRGADRPLADGARWSGKSFACGIPS